MKLTTLGKGRSLVKSILPAPIKRLGRKVHYQLSNRLSLAEQIIEGCKAVQFFAESIPQPRLRVTLLEIARFIGDLALLARQYPRVDINLLQGPEGEVIFIGDAMGADEFAHLFFSSEQVNHTRVGQVALWEIPATTQAMLKQGSFAVICELSRLYPWRFNAPVQVTTPKWIAQVLPLPEQPDDFLKGRRGRELRNAIHRHPELQEFRFSQDQADFDQFYYSMYVPYVSARHGSLVFVEPYEVLLRWFKRGGLVLVLQNQKPVAASLVYKRQDWVYAIDGGVLNASQDLLKARIYRFMVWSTIRWANQQGARYIHMGGTYAWRSNGVFQFKHEWKTSVLHLYGFTYGQWICLMNDLPPEQINLLNQKGLIIKKHQKYYGVVFDDAILENDEQYLSQALKSAREDGLAGIVLKSAHQTRFIEDTQPATHQEEATDVS
ncbi:MAG: GNAT family N-acetyltransferase [Anaerolineaceae bacterium]|nr:GNAT family N-acetyltransferase [Anaerolineaceae bacterium]